MTRDIDRDIYTFDIDNTKVGNIRYRYFTIKESRNEYNRIFKYILYRRCHRLQVVGIMFHSHLTFLNRNYVKITLTH